MKRVFRSFAGKFPKISRDYHAFRVFKSSVFQPFSAHNKREDGVFKLTHFLCTIYPHWRDSKLNSKNKIEFSNISGVVWKADLKTLIACKGFKGGSLIACD